MTNREKLKSAVLGKIEPLLGAFGETSAEHTVVTKISGDVDGKPVSVVVTQFPEGENPETYQGKEKWVVEVMGEEGELYRTTNPEETLELALQLIDWTQIAGSL